MNDVAVLIPVYNDQLGLEATLASLKKEEDISLDIIVVDDGSATTITVPETIGNHKIIFIPLPQNKGIETALNTGLAYIIEHGYKYVGRIDSGDICMNNRFKKQYDYLESDTECVLVGAQVRHVDEKGTDLFIESPPSEHQDIRKSMHINTAFAHPAVMFRSDIIQEIGEYSLNYKAAEDYDLFFRMVKKYKTKNLPEILVVKEYNLNSISVKKRKVQLKSRLKIQIKNFNFLLHQSYLGIVQTIALLVFPDTLTIKLKSYLKK